SLDNTSYTTCTSPVQFTSANISDATHTFKVLAEDNSTNRDPSPASFNWTVDTVPPDTSIASAIDGHKSVITTGSNTSSNSVTFTFSANDTGGVGVDHIECSLDNASYTTCTSPVQFTSANISDGTHTFKVSAHDNVGNISPSPSSFTWTVDTVPPTTTINTAIDGNKSAITNGSNTGSNSVTFTFSANDTGGKEGKGVGINVFECSIDNSNFTTCTSPVQFTPHTLVDGSHVFKIRAEDNVGNKDPSPSSFNWTIDTVLPTATINTVIDGNKSTITNGSNIRSNSVTFTFSANDTGGVGVDHIECSLDNSNFTTCTSPIQFTPHTLVDGSHVFKIRAEDNVRNKDRSPPSFIWTLDTMPPVTSINTVIDGNKSAISTGGNTSSNSVTFEFSGTDTGIGVNHFECSVDSSKFITCTSPLELNTLKDGIHTLEARAQDSVGNKDLSP